MMVGRRSFPFGMAYFQGRTVKLQEGMITSPQLCLHIDHSHFLRIGYHCIPLGPMDSQSMSIIFFASVPMRSAVPILKKTMQNCNCLMAITLSIAIQVRVPVMWAACVDLQDHVDSLHLLKWSAAGLNKIPLQRSKSSLQTKFCVVHT